jgi:hypothetical protein
MATMASEILIATLLLCRSATFDAHAARLTESRASYYAAAIARSLGGPDASLSPYAIAASIANLERETRYREDAIECRISGIEGWGGWGINAFWERHGYPGSTRTSILLNARAGHDILWRWKRFDPLDPRPGFSRYLGAGPFALTEGRERARIYRTILDQIEALACI